MKATRFRVQNFRNIDDSDWIYLEKVTAFVGRNESGKTSLLNSPLKKPIRAAAGPCGRNTALRALAESQDGTRLRALSSTTMARPRLQSDFINGLLRPCTNSIRLRRNHMMRNGSFRETDTLRITCPRDPMVKTCLFVRLSSRFRRSFGLKLKSCPG